MSYSILRGMRGITLRLCIVHALSSSERSGGLVLYWNDEIKLEVLGHSKYHIGTSIAELGTTPSCLTCIYEEAVSNL